MVSLDDIHASNAKVATSLPSGLVAVFAGATSGIGEAALTEFARAASKPRIYFIGRSLESAERIDKVLKEINPGGEYTFIGADASLVENVDEICRELKSKEKVINLLFMSQGTLKMHGGMW